MMCTVCCVLCAAVLCCAVRCILHTAVCPLPVFGFIFTTPHTPSVLHLHLSLHFHFHICQPRPSGMGETLTVISTVFWTLHITYTDMATTYVCYFGLSPLSCGTVSQHSLTCSSSPPSPTLTTPLTLLPTIFPNQSHHTSPHPPSLCPSPLAPYLATPATWTPSP